MPRLALLALITVLTLAACGGTENEAGSLTSPTATTATSGDEVLEGASTEPANGPIPTVTSGDGVTALVERVDAAAHEGYDRVVFQFRGFVPGYRVEYAEPPLHEDGSGAEVTIDGDAFVTVRMEPASGFDLTTGEGVLVYTGPRRISGADKGTTVVRELVRTGDFEAVLTWAVGLSERVDFRVQTLAGPPRLVVDFRSG